MKKFQHIVETYCLKKKIDFVTYLGQGAFKEVYKVKSQEQSYSLKIIDPNKVNFGRLNREVESIKACNSDHISKLFGIDEFKFQNVVYLLTIEEYLSGGNLTNKISKQKLHISEVKTIGLSICNAIDCMWNHKLVHRDIKPDNIMFRDETLSPILIDFGLVRDLSSSSLTQDWAIRGPGTPFFASPEQLNNDKALIDWKTDQFSLGITLSLCIFDKHPYSDNSNNPMITISNVAEKKNHAYDFQIYQEHLWYDLIIKMTKPWPYQRYTDISKLIEEMNKMEE